MSGAERLERVEATGLTCTYPGSGRGIWDVGLRLQRGSFTVVAGASGAGKTTLLRALLGLLPADAGEVRWNGALVTSPLVAAPAHLLVPPRVAYVVQARAGSAKDLCEQVTHILEGGGELLVVDDLSAVLDVRQERALWDRSFWRWGACLAVSNRLPALSRADHILVLAEGKVVREGRLEELLPTCTQMRWIWARP